MLEFGEATLIMHDCEEVVRRWIMDDDGINPQDVDVSLDWTPDNTDNDTYAVGVYVQTGEIMDDWLDRFRACAPRGTTFAVQARVGEFVGADPKLVLSYF